MIGVMMLKTGESEYMYFFLAIAGSNATEDCLLKTRILLLV